jgi:hypothetical protein
LVPNDGCVTVQAHLNLIRFPKQVLKLTRGDAAEVLLFRKRTSTGIDQLKVIRMELSRDVHIALYQCLKALAFGRPNDFSFLRGAASFRSV